ncbi:MAG: FecR domain-containing protein [Bacteroidota bacterium]
MNNPRREDLIADPSFQNYVLGKVPEDVAYWTNWLARHPERKEDVAEATAFLQHISLPEIALPPQAKQMDRQKLMAALPEVHATRSLRPLMAVAASVVLLAFVGAWWFSSPDPDPWVLTEAGQQQSVQLPDGSQVILNADARLKYASVWDKQQIREVWLKGEAWFDVQAFPSAGRRKFVVHLEDSDIEVLGTEFNVRQEKDQLDVVLASGAIRFVASEDTIRMQPGEHLSMQKGKDPMLSKDVDLQVHTIWKEHELDLNGMTIQEVADWIQAKHGINIQFEDTAGTNLELSGRLPAEDSALLLDALSELLDMNMNQTDSIVRFTHKF